MNLSKEEICSLADKLLIGLTDEEISLVQTEFESIKKNMDLINEIPNIKDVEPQSFPFEMEVSELRSDDDVIDEIDIDTLLSNCDRVEGREIEVPKVVME